MGRPTARQVLFDVKSTVGRRDERQEYRRLLDVERLDVATIQRLQSERALAIARFAFANSAFYGDLYSEHGLAAADFEDPTVLSRLPIVEKTDVRANFERFRSSEASEATATVHATGGSTGHPTKILHDRRASQHLLSRRLHRWWGVHPADNRALIWRDQPAAVTPREKLRELASWPTRVLHLNANQLGEAEFRRFVEQWKVTRPALVSGYVGAVLELARFLADGGIRLPPPTAVALTSAPVAENQKAFLRQVFDAPVYDHYQCMEVPMIGGECEQVAGLHVFSDARWVEILGADGRPVGPGETGDVVLTDLRNRVFPIVRYRLGDRASWKIDGCPCGRPFPVLNPIAGRISELLRLPSGLTIAGQGLMALFDLSLDAVRQFQLCQHADSSLTLRCIRGTDPGADAVMRRVTDGLIAMVRGEVPVRLEVMDAIPSDGGKTRFLVREGADGRFVPPQLAATDASVGTGG